MKPQLVVRLIGTPTPLEIPDPSRELFNEFNQRIINEMPLRYTNRSGAEAIIPHHAVISVAYAPGDEE